MKGAGGTEGGVARFFIGLGMTIAGVYLFLEAVQVTHQFGLGQGLYRVGNFHLTTGMVLIPLIFGIGFIFYNAKSLLGWSLSAASLIMLVFGILSTIKLRLRPMSSFELVSILILMIGGLGLFFSSLRDFKPPEEPGESKPPEAPRFE